MGVIDFVKWAVFIIALGIAWADGYSTGYKHGGDEARAECEKTVATIEHNFKLQSAKDAKELDEANQRAQDANTIIASAKRPQACKPSKKVAVKTGTGATVKPSDSLRLDTSFRSDSQWMRIAAIAELHGDDKLSMQAKSNAAKR